MRAMTFAFAFALGGLTTAIGAFAEPVPKPDQLAGLQPILRIFDFEEPNAAPNALPADFYRYIAPSQGFPPFGSMHLIKQTGFSGARMGTIAGNTRQDG